MRCAFHSVADVTVGVARMIQRNQDKQLVTNPVAILDTAGPAINARVMTYAYPRFASIIGPDSQTVHFNSTCYDGYIKEHFPMGRDKTFLPGPCYQTNIHIHGGASGGPVFGPNGCVFGVNSTGIDGTDISYVSSVAAVLDLTLDEVSIEGRSPRPVCIRDMVHAGHVKVRP